MRGIFSKKFFMATVIISIVLILPCLQKLIFVPSFDGYLFPSGYFMKVYFDNIKSETFLLIVPILAGIPCSTSFIDDKKSKYIMLYISRINRKKYIFSKISISFTTGFLMILISLLLSYHIVIFISLNFEFIPEINADYTETLLELIPRTCMFASFCSCTALCFGSLIFNKYVAYSAPFIVVYTLVIISERYIKNFYIIYPKEWISFEHEWVLGSVSIVILFVFFILILSLIFYFVVNWRLNSI